MHERNINEVNNVVFTAIVSAQKLQNYCHSYIIIRIYDQQLDALQAIFGQQKFTGLWQSNAARFLLLRNHKKSVVEGTIVMALSVCALFTCIDFYLKHTKFYSVVIALDMFPRWSTIEMFL